MNNIHDHEKRLIGKPRPEAREAFKEWAETEARVFSEVELKSVEKDRATFHVRTSGNHTARNLMLNYGGDGRAPLRVIGLDAVDENRVAITVLLAEIDE